MSKRNLGSFLFLALAFFLLSSLTGCGGDSGENGSHPPAPPVVTWNGTQQLGTPNNDMGYGIALDSSGNIYITGSTGGNLDGNLSAGNLDIFLVKYDPSGLKKFTRQMGTVGDDIGNGIAVDSSGNIYIAGSTGGNLDGNISSGLSDIFLVKYDSTGLKQFTRQIGTTGNDIGYAVAVDSSGNVYVVGSTEGGLDGNTPSGFKDIFLIKFDSSGVKLFTRQFGTPGNDIAYGIAVDSSDNIYITGSTEGNLDGNTSSGLLDIFLTKFDSSGNRLSTIQFGTPRNDIGRRIAIDINDNVYIAGATDGNLDGHTSSGFTDIFLVKFDSSGVKQFTRQFGTPGDDIAYGVAVDSNANIYITGSTEGNLDGNTSSGMLDIFLTKFDFFGQKLFTDQLGTPRNDVGYGIALGGSSSVFITGSTEGNLDGNISSGLSDIFLVKYNSFGVKQ